jgi:Regulator of ribonuclease activity B
MPRRLPVGEVVRIETPLGLLFAQAVGVSRTWGTLFRAPAQVFSSRPDSLPVGPSVAAFAHLEAGVGSAFPEVSFTRLGKASVSRQWQEMPVFRDERLDERTLESYTALSDGRTGEILVDRPTEKELAGHPPLIIGGPYALVYYVLEAAGEPQSNPTLARWFGLEEQARAVTHYLTFGTESSARAAAREMETFGAIRVRDNEGVWTVEVDSGDASSESLASLESEFGRIADGHGGEYDGRDVPVGKG